ncbi:hypothetical protein CFP56_026834 [Quercus suber]|uniref:Uncharacterized protein n=1 Tax=Quercus suber TaxID=58331 RepID=A0AAW0JZE9_QUESU
MDHGSFHGAIVWFDAEMIVEKKCVNAIHWVSNFKIFCYKHEQFDNEYCFTFESILAALT